MVTKKLIYRPQLWNTNVSYECWPTLQSWFCIAEIRQLNFFFWNFSTTHAVQSITANLSWCKHWPIKANLYSRPLRNALLKSAKEVNNDPSSALYFAEDMTKADHELKLKARAQMEAAHDAGHRVCFRRGKLIIDSRVTAIEGANGSGGSVHANVHIA